MNKIIWYVSKVYIERANRDNIWPLVYCHYYYEDVDYILSGYKILHKVRNTTDVYISKLNDYCRFLMASSPYDRKKYSILNMNSDHHLIRCVSHIIVYSLDDNEFIIKEFK